MGKEEVARFSTEAQASTDWTVIPPAPYRRSPVTTISTRRLPQRGADEPIVHERFGAVPSGHLGGIGLDLMLAALAPGDQPDAGGGSVPSVIGGL
jgi:hypothetical protein